MAAKRFAGLFATLALLQTINCQCINNLASQPTSPPAAPFTNVILSNGATIPADILSIISGACGVPTGIRVNTDNLELTGTVGVSGALPFIGTIALNGALPSSGQATVSYSTASGVGINNAGCGQGVGNVENSYKVSAPVSVCN